MVRNNLCESLVAISSAKGSFGYPAEPPFRPDVCYPEIHHLRTGSEKNVTYELVRQVFFNLGMDSARFGTPEWNPLGEIIQPGQTVLIKPNWVRHIHMGGGDINIVITHGSIVRCVLDYVAKALDGKGKIVVGDAPIQSADFQKILLLAGMTDICDEIEGQWGMPVNIEDFRLVTIKLGRNRSVKEKFERAENRSNYIAVNLGKYSLLDGLSDHPERFRVTSYDCGEMIKHHNRQTHEYLIPKAVLDADVVINLPKLKTHRKAGMTSALKNLVGINGYKDWLPHHRIGSVKEGGDEYLNPSLIKRMHTTLCEQIDRDPFSPLNPVRRIGLRITHRLIRTITTDAYIEGSWYGNDTVWRMALDLNRLLLYVGRNGKMSAVKQRRCFTIVDAIIAGEGEGPMEPAPRSCGIIAGGMNPVAVDTVLATLIGFDYRKIPIVANSFGLNKWPLVDFAPHDIRISTIVEYLKDMDIHHPFRHFSFEPSNGWKGHIEADDNV